MDAKRKEDLRKAVILIRFRSLKPIVKSHKYTSYKTISEVVGLSVNEVQHICRKALIPKRVLTFSQRAFRLDQSHIDFLTDPLTLE